MKSGKEKRFASIYAAMGSHARAELYTEIGGALTSEGCIDTDEHQRTPIPGVWAIGDVVDALDQMAVAIGHAAIATTDVHNSLTNGIKPKFVHSGMKHDLKLPAGTKLHILAPEKDVDHFYLGEELDTTLNGFNGLTAALSPTATAVPTSATQPANISASDFRVLQSRMLSNALTGTSLRSSA